MFAPVNATARRSVEPRVSATPAAPVSAPAVPRASTGTIAAPIVIRRRNP
jgi:hypothetical protein